jgi:hypothetical protein
LEDFSGTLSRRLRKSLRPEIYQARRLLVDAERLNRQKSKGLHGLQY